MAAALTVKQSDKGASATGRPLKPGSSVRVVGIKQQVDCNGKDGVILSWDMSSGRWVVELYESAKRKCIKPENLIVIKRPKLMTFEADEGDVITVPRGYLIKRAFWGSRDAPFDFAYGTDVTETVRIAIAQSDSGGKVKAHIELFGDPRWLRSKALIIEVERPKKAAKAGTTAEEDDDATAIVTSTLMAKEGETLPAIPKGMTVRRAFYGDPVRHWDLTRGFDVTNEVKDLLRAAKAVEASNALFGDPLRFYYKVLVVELEETVSEELKWHMSVMEVGTYGTVVSPQEANNVPAHWGLRGGGQDVDSAEAAIALGHASVAFCGATEQSDFRAEADRPPTQWGAIDSPPDCRPTMEVIDNTDVDCAQEEEVRELSASGRTTDSSLHSIDSAMRSNSGRKMDIVLSNGGSTPSVLAAVNRARIASKDSEYSSGLPEVVE